MPEQLRQESQLMERLVNFYVTFVGGLRIGRGDNFYMRLFRKPIIDTLLGDHEVNTLKQDALFFYGGLLYNYSKNVYYYKYAFENVKAGNDKFNLPLKSGFKEVYSNMFILKLFDENFVNTILQDINQKTIKIYVSNKDILKVFKNMLGSEISKLMKASKPALVEKLYGNVAHFLKSLNHFLPTLKKQLDSEDIAHIKDNLYTLDLRMWMEALQSLVNADIDLNATYGDLSIMGISAGLRETIFGFLLYYIYLQEEARTTGIELQFQALKRIYVLDVLNLSETYYTHFDHMIEQLVIRYHPILSLWIGLDENKQYFKVGLNNWLNFIENKSQEQIT
ncbi:MAG: hypothetical protein H6765_08590 [Candidatus Peribacteria bacterium]|nr:MAG: hypothetical protein H6765_08590 [Candidatus Peribacteria bacterium]